MRKFPVWLAVLALLVTAGSVHAQSSKDRRIWGGADRTQEYPELRYVPESEDPSITLETADLVMKVIDNTGILAPTMKSRSYFNDTRHMTPIVHHLGYHGLRSLYNKTEKRNLVSPFSSWLNLQRAEISGITADPIDARASWGMGRGWPMRMEKMGAGVILHIDPLPNMQMRYSLELQPAEPDAIDFRVRFEFGVRPTSGPARFRASWPCYVNALDDVRLFYPRGPSPTVWEWAGIGEKLDIVLGDPVGYTHAQKGYVARDQALPVGYGLIGDRALILMFDDPSVNLFVVVNGGYWPFNTVQKPAWDFQWDLDEYPLHTPVGFDGRLIYTPFRGPDQVLARYKDWIGGQTRN